MAGISLFRTSAAPLPSRLLLPLFFRAYGSASAVQIQSDDEEYEEYFSPKEDPNPSSERCFRGRGVQWVVMGDPGAQKHVYAEKLSKLLHVPHISMGTLLRDELHPCSSLYQKLRQNSGETPTAHVLTILPGTGDFSDHCLSGLKIFASPTKLQRNSNGHTFLPSSPAPVTSPIIVSVDSKYLHIANALNQQKLVTEEITFGLLSKRLEECYYKGETGFILDGIPRTRVQAEILDQLVDIDLVVNFKCFGNDSCSHCSQFHNPRTSISNMQLQGCSQRSPNTTVDSSFTDKGQLHTEQSNTLEEYYMKQKKLLNFKTGGGPGETWQGLLAALHLHPPPSHSVICPPSIHPSNPPFKSTL